MRGEGGGDRRAVERVAQPLLQPRDAVLVLADGHVVGGLLDEPDGGDQLGEADDAEVGDTVAGEGLGAEVEQVGVTGAAQAVPGEGVRVADAGERSGHPSRSP